MNIVSFRHLLRLSDSRGILEHANGTVPRLAHGYCTDDNARLLVTALDNKGISPGADALVGSALRFVLEARVPGRGFRNRMSFGRTWIDDPTTDDCWGRALQALAAAASDTRHRSANRVAGDAFLESARHRSEFPRAAARAALAAARFLRTNPGDVVATELLADSADLIAGVRPEAGMPTSWRWFEDRLSYDNAVLPHSLIAAGTLLDDPDHLAAGLDALEWLVRDQIDGEHLSLVPHIGRGPADPRPAFDQQPIEAAALAAAADEASRIDRNPLWRWARNAAETWFLGANDGTRPLLDHESGGGYDALTADGVNTNQGAESTLALVSTLQRRAQRGDRVDPTGWVKSPSPAP